MKIIKEYAEQREKEKLEEAAKYGSKRASLKSNSIMEDPDENNVNLRDSFSLDYNPDY